MTEAAKHADIPLIDSVRSEIEREGLSQAVAAREIGISDAALSQWLRGVYKGDSGGVAEGVRKWLATRAERRDRSAEVPDPPAWVETKLARRALAGLAHAHLFGQMCAVYGAPGLGKTTACERYASLKTNVWLATADRYSRSVSASLGCVAEAMRLRPDRRGASATARAVVSRMRGSGGLLIVDEAQHLPVPALEGLRSLHDASGCGLALVGSDPLWLRISDGGRPELAQLFSRVSKRVWLDAPSAADATALLGAWRLAGNGLDALACRIAARPGGLRGLTNVLALAHVNAGSRPVKVTHLRSAWRDLTGEALPARKRKSVTRGKGG